MEHFSMSLCLIALFLVNICQIIVAENVIIPTKLGQIKGEVLLSDQGRKYLSFRGIRYAKAPTNSLRFKAPVPAGSWKGIYNATKDGPICLHTESTTWKLFGEEDCLFLNIYRPQKSEFAKFPVMIFIHGGGLIYGSGTSLLYGPERFMDKDVTLVIFNYRLGSLGFLSTNDEVAPGNFGLLDQQLVFQWVHDHISDYGGDPNSVTIFGESSGGHSVALHLLSPLSKGLFHAAIMQSGNSESDPGFDYRSPAITTAKLAAKLKCPTASTRATIDCLRNKSGADIVKEALILIEQEPAVTFRPTVDKVRGRKAFMPRHPKQILLNGDINIVPTISGATRDEGIFFYSILSVGFGGLSKAGSDALQGMLSIIYPEIANDPTAAKRAVHIIKSLYFANEDATNLTQRAEIMNKIFSAAVDINVDNTNEILSRRGCPVYPYKFSYRGRQSWMLEVLPLNDSRDIIKDLNLVAHADDLQYLFHFRDFKNTTLVGDEVKMADIFLTLWTNFAKTKKPLMDGNDFQWKTFNAKQPEYLDLNLNPKMAKGYLCEDRSLWNAILQFHDSFQKTTE